MEKDFKITMLNNANSAAARQGQKRAYAVDQS
jgi:hypothetical protein